jgi:hypothetical protein
LAFFPQNSVNQRPTMALLSSCLLIEMAPHGLLVRIIETDRRPKQRTKLEPISRNSGSYLGIKTARDRANPDNMALRSPVEIGSGASQSAANRVMARSSWAIAQARPIVH